MPRELIDRRGQRFGRLVVLSVKRSDGDTWVTCQCDCGTRKTLRVGGLLTKTTQSCGCLRSESVRARRRTHGESSCHRSGARGSAEYRSWRAMVGRCTSPDAAHRRLYVERGISVCDRWRHSFEAFLEDMGRRPSPDHSLDRFPDNDGNYEPGNVRWATRSEQARNRRDRPRTATGLFAKGSL